MESDGFGGGGTMLARAVDHELQALLAASGHFAEARRDVPASDGIT